MVEDINVECVIYCATFPNGKKYIGQTKRRFVDRYKEHKYASSLDGEKEYPYPFYFAIKKYGFDSIDWSILEVCNSIDDLDNREIYWIEKYNSFIGFDNSNGYNATIGGSFNPNLEVKKSEIFYVKSLYWENKDIEYVMNKTGLSKFEVEAIIKIKNTKSNIKKDLVYKIKNLLADGVKPEDISVKLNISCRSVINIMFLNSYKDICSQLNEVIESKHYNFSESYSFEQIVKAKLDLANGKSLGEVAYYNNIKFYTVKNIQNFKRYNHVMEHLNKVINTYKRGYVKITNK